VKSAGVQVQRFILGVLLFVIAGCGGPAAAPTTSEGRRVGAIVAMHNMMETTTGHPPPNEQAFKEFIGKNGSHVIARAKVTGVDELFTSDRDGQPLVIVYGKYPAGMAAKIVCFEKNGAEGKRFVGFNSGAVELIEDARFNTLVPASVISK
jgi:hypothetical protein